MNIESLTQFIRLQIDEEVEAYWKDTDLLIYIKLATENFLARSRAGLWREEIIPDTTKVQDKEQAEIVSLTCVSDDTLGLDSIDGESFILFDTDDNQWTFTYSKTGTVSTTDFLVYIAIAADDTNAVVASKTASAINNIVSSPFRATNAAEVVTITWKKKGYVIPPANIDVDDGSGLFAFSVTQQGYDDGYFLTYKFQREKSILFTGGSDPATNGKDKVTRIGMEDYSRLMTSDRIQKSVCAIDPRLSKLFMPYTDNSLIVEYYVLVTNDTLDAVISEVIPEDFHLAIAYYCLYMMFIKDNDLNRSNIHLQHFLAMVRDAKEMMQERYPMESSDNFDFTNHSPHAEFNLPDQADFLGIGSPGRTR